MFVLSVASSALSSTMKRSIVWNPKHGPRINHLNGVNYFKKISLMQYNSSRLYDILACVCSYPHVGFSPWKIVLVSTVSAPLW